MSLWRRLFPHPLLTFVLALVWLLLVNSIAPGQVVMGLLLGALIPRFTDVFWQDRPRIRRPLVLLRYIAIVLHDIVVASVVVTRLVLGPKSRLRPAFVYVPLDLTDDLAISIFANTISLTPGTVSSQVAADRSHLIVHALDVADADELVAAVKARYERPLREIFETC